jgi:hypothetical protein
MCIGRDGASQSGSTATRWPAAMSSARRTSPCIMMPRPARAALRREGPLFEVRRALTRYRLFAPLLVKGPAVAFGPVGETDAAVTGEVLRHPGMAELVEIGG